MNASVPTDSAKTITVTVSESSPGVTIPPGFQGFSFELLSLLPGPDGLRLFRADNTPLVNLFRTLGIESLRIGGNTGDRDFRQAPTEKDIDSLFTFAKAAGTKVVYCLRLLNSDPREQTRIAKYIWDRYEPELECFTIGQEPSAYPAEKRDDRASSERMGAEHERYRYEDFASNWTRFDDEIRRAIPSVRIGGPGVHLNPVWTKRFIDDFAKDGRITEITAHLYPGGPGNNVRKTPEAGRERMLSGEFENVYGSLGDAVIPLTASKKLGFRIEEGNNFFNGGAENVSDTFTASLWGLDCLWWWAVHGALGFNFHTGNEVAAGDLITPCRYAVFYSDTGSVSPKPLALGIKAFELGAKGRVLPVKLSSRPSTLSAYAARDSGTLLVTLINRAHGPEAAPIDISLEASDAVGSAESIALTAPGGDVTARRGITLGGADIGTDGSWSGKWTPVSPHSKGVFRIRLAPSSALIMRIPVRDQGSAGVSAPASS